MSLLAKDQTFAGRYRVEALLAEGGIVTMEFPHLVRLIAENQFDTIYHEHFSYLSFTTTRRIFAHHGLTLFDVDELPTHGGSLRIYAQHENGPRARSSEVDSLLARERGVRTVLMVPSWSKTARLSAR